MSKYSETHHLNVDEDGLASVHVAMHLQGADLPTARLFVLRVLDVAGEFARPLEPPAPPDGIFRPQTSGPCVHFDPDGVFSPDGDGEQGEHQDSAPACAYPSERGALCPHLDNPEILCPVKDACSAMSEVARMRDACEAEQEEQDADMAAQDAVYETETPEFADPGRLHTYVVEPEPEFPEPVPEEELVYEAPPRVGEMRLDARGWTREEEGAMREATTPTEAVALYRAAYPGSVRTDAAIKSRYHLKIRPQRGATPAPDFAGDAVPVTQCEGPAGKGLYGDARALHADLMDGMMCDRPIDAYEPIAVGDRVALVEVPGRIGEVEFVSKEHASVLFPGSGPARVFALDELRRVAE